MQQFRYIGSKINLPDVVVIEMILDWMAACRAYNGHWPTKDNWEWAEKNLSNLRSKLNNRTDFLMVILLRKLDLIST
jgi:hypothetical protein